jgi:hypothetical protein
MNSARDWVDVERSLTIRWRSVALITIRSCTFERSGPKAGVANLPTGIVPRGNIARAMGRSANTPSYKARGAAPPGRAPDAGVKRAYQRPLVMGVLGYVPFASGWAASTPRSDKEPESRSPACDHSRSTKTER